MAKESEADGVVLGSSGWFTPHGTRYHGDRRAVTDIVAQDWSALLDYAEAVGFFIRPEPDAASPDQRIFHLRITAGGRTRELAINDPYDDPELARLVGLARRCLRDRQVIRTADMSPDELSALLALVQS